MVVEIKKRYDSSKSSTTEDIDLSDTLPYSAVSQGSKRYRPIFSLLARRSAGH